MLNTFLERARQDLPVYLTDVRRAFQAEGTRPFSLHVTLYGGSVKRFPLLLPQTRSGAETEFAASYVYATVYNILSSLGAVRIDVYLDPKDAQASALAAALDDVFQTRLPKAERAGYGKCLNVNERILRFFSAGSGPFGFRALDIAEEPEVPPAAPTPAVQGIFEKLPPPHRRARDPGHGRRRHRHQAGRQRGRQAVPLQGVRLVPRLLPHRPGDH